MTQDQLVEQCENGESVPVEYGGQLTAARVKSKQSLGAIAQQLRITSAVVALLESGCWKNAGPDVYVRGYIIAFCRIVNLDASRAISYFKQRELERVARDSVETHSRQRRPEPVQYQRVAAYAAATLLIGPALLFWVAQGFRGGDLPAGSESQEQLAQSPVAVLQTLLDPSSQAGVGTPVMASMATVPEALAVKAEVGNAVNLLPPAESASNTQMDASVLELSFQEEVWLEVSDSSGKRLGYGLMTARSMRSFPIDRGLTVRLGNADAVVAKVDGELLNLQPYTDQDVAEFSLPLTNPGNDLSELSLD